MSASSSKLNALLPSSCASSATGAAFAITGGTSKPEISSLALTGAGRTVRAVPSLALL